MTIPLKDIRSLSHTLMAAPDATMVVGDLEAFSRYIETGQAFQDWQTCYRIAARERERFFIENQHLWHHIVSPSSMT